MHTFSELMDEYAAHASKEQMEELADLTNDFVEDVSKTEPELAKKYLEDAQNILCQFRDEEEAEKFVSELENIDGTDGPQWKHPFFFSSRRRHTR